MLAIFDTGQKAENPRDSKRLKWERIESYNGKGNTKEEDKERSRYQNNNLGGKF